MIWFLGSSKYSTAVVLLIQWWIQLACVHHVSSNHDSVYVPLKFIFVKVGAQNIAMDNYVWTFMFRPYVFLWSLPQIASLWFAHHAWHAACRMNLLFHFLGMFSLVSYSSLRLKWFLCTLSLSFPFPCTYLWAPRCPHPRTYSSVTTRASVANYFDQLSTFPTSELSSCQETSETLTLLLRQYMEDTGDSAGLTAGELGELQRNCSDNFWWLAPECRSSLDCIPLLLRDVEGLPSAMLSATAFDMPLGIARVDNFQSFVRLVKESNALFYWWYPDTLVLMDQPQQLYFPRVHGDSILNRCSGKAVSASLKVPWCFWHIHCGTWCLNDSAGQCIVTFHDSSLGLKWGP